MSNSIISSNEAPKPVGAYPHARRVGNLLFLSGVGPRIAAVCAVLLVHQPTNSRPKYLMAYAHVVLLGFLSCHLRNHCAVVGFDGPSSSFGTLALLPSPVKPGKCATDPFKIFGNVLSTPQNTATENTEADKYSSTDTGKTFIS